jgi:hypothetical protein
LTGAVVASRLPPWEVISGALTAESNDLLPVPAGSTLNTLVVLNRRLGWLPSVGGNEADLLSDYEESIAAMAGEIRTAERYVHVEFYTIKWVRAKRAQAPAASCVHELGLHDQ